jgi:hypothetical protein
MTYLFFVFTIPDLILNVKWPLKIILLGALTLVVSKLFDTINNMVDIPTFRQQLYETNKTIKMLCVFILYSLGYLFVSYY